MKRMLKKVLVVTALALTANFSFAQSANLQGKALSAANECLQSFDYMGTGTKMTVFTEEVGTCPDGSAKYAVNIWKVGHCPGGMNILCLVIAFPIATVTFDCNENVESIVCFN